MSLRSALAFALALGLLLHPAVSLACSCVATTLEQARDAADAVFEGVVTDAEPDTKHGRRVTLRVVRVWKGDEDSERTVVYTADNSAACGVGFEVGTGYLVFAKEADGALFTSLCSRTQRSKDASDDFAKLGAGITPVDLGGSEEGPSAPEAPAEEAEAPDTGAPKKGGFASCNALAGEQGTGPIGWLFLLSLAALWALRRARRVPSASR